MWDSAEPLSLTRALQDWSCRVIKYTLLSDRSPSCVADEQIQLVCLWEDAEDKDDTEVCGWMAGCIHAFSHVCIILAAHCLWE